MGRDVGRGRGLLTTERRAFKFFHLRRGSSQLRYFAFDSLTPDSQPVRFSGHLGSTARTSTLVLNGGLLCTMEAPRTVEDVFDNFSARRDGLIKALTTGTTPFTIRRRFTPKKPRFIPQTSRTSTRSATPIRRTSAFTATPMDPGRSNYPRRRYLPSSRSRRWASTSLATGCR